MADPTIQTFCCHHGNTTHDLGLSIMNEFNSDAYNSVCLFSSSIGMFGAIYQILPRKQYANNHRWISFSAARGRRIIIWLAVADLMASLGVFMRSILWIRNKSIMPAMDDRSSIFYCVLFAAWTQYFYTSTWIWTLCYAIDMRFVLSEKDAKTKHYHLAAWLIPAALTFFGLSLLYIPDASCHTTTTLSNAIVRILPNYFATYLPIATVMIANPILYHLSSKDMCNAIINCYGQMTTRERDIIDAIKVKFAVINIVFYVCWIPNLINGILLWTLWFHLPVQCVIGVWYIMAFTNPLQALFNCLVYRRWRTGSEQIIFPFHKKSAKQMTNTKRPQVEDANERLPLLTKD